MKVIELFEEYGKSLDITRKDISDLHDIFDNMSDDEDLGYPDVDIKMYNSNSPDFYLVLTMDLIPGFNDRYAKGVLPYEKLKSIFKNKIATVSVSNPQDAKFFTQVAHGYCMRYKKYGDLYNLRYNHYNKYSLFTFIKDKDRIIEKIKEVCKPNKGYRRHSFSKYKKDFDFLNESVYSDKITQEDITICEDVFENIIDEIDDGCQVIVRYFDLMFNATINMMSRQIMKYNNISYPNYTIRDGALSTCLRETYTNKLVVVDAKMMSSYVNWKDRTGKEFEDVCQKNLERCLKHTDLELLYKEVSPSHIMFYLTKNKEKVLSEISSAFERWRNPKY